MNAADAIKIRQTQPARPARRPRKNFGITLQEWRRIDNRQVRLLENALRTPL